ncbi:hypothetical protein RJ640_030376 [Escallonia rubra]|uniref:Snurportin-1 n=1 Tax=Escallonia rubra TaxID=112253 RepID=A0AA88R2Z9_9ASTE|nr:hypothetical protein RJ640_030376 [Escallonia rubra]
MAPHDLRRPFKRPAVSDQQKRRELSLLRQNQNRRDAQNQARCLASTVLSFPNQPESAFEPEPEPVLEDTEPELGPRDIDIRQSSKLRGPEARRWFAKQLMLPEWMIDVPDRLSNDWEDVRSGLRITEWLSGRGAFRGQGTHSKLAFLVKHHFCTVWTVVNLRSGIFQVNFWCLCKKAVLITFFSDVRYVCARPSGQRCFVVSSNGITVSRLRNGSLLHRFPSALPNGSRAKDASRSAQSYCILDCIFHELDQTYYVVDMVCWAGISFYECTAEFRFYWLNNKLVETSACDGPSRYHRYRFSMVPMYNCDHEGMHTAYTGPVPYVRDGLLFYNKKFSKLSLGLYQLVIQVPVQRTAVKEFKVAVAMSRLALEYLNLHAHYQTGNTPLALVWKDENCSQYVIDTDSKGQIPHQQQVVLELQDDGKLTTYDDPPVVFGFLNGEFIQKTELVAGNLLRFSVSEGGLVFADGKLEKADLQYIGKVNRARAFADSYSKIMFQHMARHSPLRIEHLLASICSPSEQENVARDVEMLD